MTDQKELSSAQPKTIDGLMRLVSGNPICKRTGCHGKGYVGIRQNEDGSQTLLLCDCGRMGVSDYAVLKGEVEEMRRELKAFRHSHQKVSLAILEWIQEAEQKTLRGTLSRWKESIRAILVPSLTEPKPDQVVPVKGEVKA